MNRPKVVFCTDGIFPLAIGGMQRHSRLLIESLASRGNTELVVIHPHTNSRVFDPALAIQEIAIEPLPGKQNYLIELYHYSKVVFEKLKGFPKAIIYSQGLSVWYGAQQLGDRLIVNPHGLEPFQGLNLKDQLKGLPYRYIFSKLFNTAKYSVALGGKLTKLIEERIKASDKEVVVLPNAVNLPEHVVPKTDFSQPMRILFVGRFAENKGIDVLMSAIDQLNAQGMANHFQFSIAGKGPLFNAYTERYHYKNVAFLGFVPDEKLAELYQGHHVFILPTRFEGMPTVVLEAMAYGMPIMVTDVGATRELVDESNGYILEKNDPQGIVDCLVDFSHLDVEEKTRMSKNSLERVEMQFTWDAVAQRHETLFYSFQ